MAKPLQLSDKSKKIVQNRDGQRCNNCGSTFALSWSHIVRKSRKPQLYDNPNNVVIHCMDCHHIWDNGSHQQRVKLRTYEQLKAKCKELDQKSYELLIVLDKSIFYEP